MIQFYDARLPEDIERGASISVAFNTSVVGIASGDEQRNIEWSEERLTADVSYGIMRKANPQDAEDSFYRIVSFFRTVYGRGVPFRFRDPTDYDAKNEVLYPIEGTTTDFQLAKTYGGGAYVRRITRPVVSTIKFRQGSTLYTAPWTHLELGIVRFDTVPPSLTASFEFDIPVRFDSDIMTVSVEHFDAAELPEIRIVQVRE